MTAARHAPASNSSKRIKAHSLVPGFKNTIPYVVLSKILNGSHVLKVGFYSFLIKVLTSKKVLI
jgi:hypothetical protein